MTNIYTACETVFAAYSTSAKIPYGAIEFDPGNAPLPETFFMYRVVSDSDAGFYDNRSARRDHRIQINIYFKDKSKIRTIPDALDTALITAGWLPQGNGRDVEQLDTGHYGWSKDYIVSLTR